jgi:hypothetical protein
MSWWTRDDELEQERKKLAQEDDERRAVELELNEYYRPNMASAVNAARSACGSDTDGLQEIDDAADTWDRACGDARSNAELTHIVRARNDCLDSVSAAVEKHRHRY